MAHAQLALADDTSYRDTYAVEDFTRDPSTFVRLLRASLSHVTLTFNESPALVLINPAEYQRLLDLAAYADSEEGIRQGTEDELAGRTRPVDEVFAEILGKYAIPR